MKAKLRKLTGKEREASINRLGLTGNPDIYRITNSDELFEHIENSPAPSIQQEWKRRPGDGQWIKVEV